ncbi:hypothetical protein ACNOYE_18520 [Nannocystaceae bacterium ST9]
MSNKETLQQAKRLSTLLSKVVASASKLSALGDAVDPPSLVYEIYVDLRVLFEVRKNWKLILQNATTVELRFPHAPGDKISYPYFLACDKQTGSPVFQICFGTEYLSNNGTTFAPDISFQIATSPPNKPSSSDVCFCMDQKFTKDPSDRVDRNLLWELSGRMKSTLEPTGPLNVLVFASKSSFPNKCHMIVTNARESTLDTQDLTSMKVSEISEYRPRSTSKCRP